MRMRFSILGICALLAGACNSTNPVAPNPQQPPPTTGGAGYGITLTATPPEIPVGAPTPATLAIAVQRSDNHQPPPAGTKVALSTDLGSFGVDGAGKPLQLQSLALDGNGKAQANFFPGTATGTAHILAQVDTSTGKLNLAVKEPVVIPFFLSSVAPNFGSASGATPVTIAGSGFVAPVRVNFGTVVATVTDVQPQAIKVLSPRPAKPVDVGTTAVVDVTVNNDLSGKTPTQDTLAGAYTYVNGPSLDRPVILSVSPASGPNSGGTVVDIRGSGFDSNPNNLQVFFGLKSPTGFNGLPATILAASPTVLQVSSPSPGSSLLNQQVDILVRNLATGFETTAAAAFKYTGAQIAATSLVPTSGPYTGGTRVTIQGQGFAAPVEVQFGGTTQIVDSVKSTTIQAHTVAVAVAACKPPSGPLSVKNLNTGEMATTGILFSYTVSQPTVLQVSPASGKQAGGDTLTITGTGFDAGVRVEVGGVTAANPQVTPDGTKITVQSPAFTGAFESVACDDNKDGQMGMKSQPAAVDVKVTSLATGCADTFPKGFSYTPDDTSCRGDLKGPPVADFDFTVNFQTVAFSDRSGGGAPDSWLWDFGDPGSGFNNSSTQQNPTHTFTTPGNYLVRLTVTNKLGSSSVVKTVQAKVPPPVADFTFSVSGHTVNFTDTSGFRGGTPASWAWDFGDSGTSTQQNPTHTYGGSGTMSFVVKLTVTNASGTDTVTKQVTVN